MSRSDLDRIQDQLKVAIQGHKILVSKMTNDPQNVNLQIQLHELQSEIRELSEKQKLVVEQQKKEILAMQSGSIQLLPTVEELTEDNSIPSQTSPTDLSCKQFPSATSESDNANHVQEVPAVPSSVGQVLSSELPDSAQLLDTTPLIKVPDYNLPRPLEDQAPQQEVNSKVPRQVTIFKKPEDIVAGINGKSNVEKKEPMPEEKRKLEYMASLSLITVSSLKELQSRRSERKRKSTTNPQFWYGNFETECGLLSSTSFYLSPAIQRTSLSYTVKYDTNEIASSVPPLASCSTEVREDCCTVCHRSGELLMCDVCSLVYHLQCLDPPLTAVPVGLWSCPKCQALSKQYGGKDDWPGTLALVHSYLMHKAAKEEEKKKMQKLSEELAAERSQLEEKAKQLKQCLSQILKKKNDLAKECSSACQTLDNLRNFIRLFSNSPTSNSNS